MEVKSFNKNSWIRCTLGQERPSYRCHIKKAFILLLTLTLLLSAILYIYDFSFKPDMPYEMFYNNVVNKIRSYYVVIEFPSAPHNHSLFLPPAPKVKLQVKQKDKTTIQTTTFTSTITAEPTVTKNNSVDYHIAYPRNYHFILDEPDICQQQNPFLVLMVPVAPHELEARNAIRSTWGNESTVQGKTVLTLFVVGFIGGPIGEKAHQRLQEESRQHRDLVQSNFLDTYFNLTIKTMVIMDWLSTRCPQASYAMKVDSDMYLNLENLMSLLLAPNTPRENYITGMVMWNRPVVRNNDSKWYVSEELYPEPNYPTYLLGMGYVFSNDLPTKIVEVSKNIKAFNIEDAYVGVCLKNLNILPSDPPDPSQFRAYLGEYKREDFIRVITTILGSPKQLIEFWQDVKNPHKEEQMRGYK